LSHAKLTRTRVGGNADATGANFDSTDTERARNLNNAIQAQAGFLENFAIKSNHDAAFKAVGLSQPETAQQHQPSTRKQPVPEVQRSR
jgi:hypothetical protein